MTTARVARILFVLACASCAQRALKPSAAEPHEQTEKSMVGVEDVDCRPLLREDAGPSADYSTACSQVDRTEGEAGRAKVDELFRELAWRVFMGYASASAHAMEGVTVSPAHAEKEVEPCIDPAAKDLALFKEPPWLPGSQGVVDGAAAMSDPAPPPVNPVWDQNGNLVRVDALLLNWVAGTVPGYEFGPACGGSAIACRAWQVSTQCGGTLTRNTAWGDLTQMGPTNLKFAWRKIVSPDDCKYGFITKSGGACGKGELGLVAMNLALKVNTQTDYWLWATFSHENNVEGDAQRGLEPLFYNPSCADCPVNVCPVGAVKKTQIKRESAIPAEVRATKQRLVKQGIVAGDFTRYDLIGVQRLPGMIAGNALPRPRPDSLANEILEWDRQGGGCVGCHARARVSSPGSYDCKQNDYKSAYCCNSDAAPTSHGVRISDGACQPVPRKATYAASFPAPSFPLSDMSWSYDHYWFEGIERCP